GSEVNTKSDLACCSRLSRLNARNSSPRIASRAHSGKLSRLSRKKGASYIDYIIADQTVIPHEYRKFYSEKIVFMPNTYQVNDRKRVISDKTCFGSRAVF